MAVIREAKAPFNLVLTDVVMPRMGGMALYHELRREGSDVPVLMMSGHTAEDLDQLEDPVTGAKFLHKPWSVTDLLRRVREVLDAGQAQRRPSPSAQARTLSARESQTQRQNRCRHCHQHQLADPWAQLELEHQKRSDRIDREVQ